MILTNDSVGKVKPKIKEFKLSTLDNCSILVTLLPTAIVEEAMRLRGQVNEDSAEAQEFGKQILESTIVDRDGNPALTADAFGQLPFAVQKEITNIIFEYNGLTKN